MAGQTLAQPEQKKHGHLCVLTAMVWPHAPPERNFVGMPRLTVRMTARIQGFPDAWRFAGKKTAAYRQIGNAFPPPVAQAVGTSILAALEASSKRTVLRSMK